MPKGWLNLSGHSGPVYDLACDGKWLYSSSADKFITRWNLVTGTQDTFSIRLPRAAFAIGIFRSQFLWVGLNSGEIHVFDLEKRVEIKHIQHHRSSIFRIICDDRNETIFIADAEGCISVWKADATLLLNIPFSRGRIRSIALQPELQLVGIASQDGTISLLDTIYFNQLNQWEAHENGTTSLLFSGNNLYSGGKDAHLCCWNRSEATWDAQFRKPAHYQTIYDLISVDFGQKIISASQDASIKIWDQASGDFILKIDAKKGGHRHSVNRLMQIDESSFASCSDDKQIKLWKL